MSSEILLVGTFSAEDTQLLKEVENRLSLHTESCVVLHREDYEFRLEAALRASTTSSTRYPLSEGAPLRARRNLVVAGSGSRRGSEWILHTCQTPNRAYKRATVRAFASIPLESGDALTFASALGYSFTKKSTRKGFLFSRGATTISLYQIVQSTPVRGGTLAQLQHPNSAIWHIEVLQIVKPATNHPKAAQLPAASYIDASVDSILSVAILMKGLVDLAPPET